MENPFDKIEQMFQGLQQTILERLPSSTDQHTGVDLERYIPLKKVSEIYCIASRTLASHKDDIEHVKRFGQIYFLKESLNQYMESGRPEQKQLKAFKTTRRHAA